ncbi:Polyisoprenoid-binding protein YceI [Epibacterium ulvae]|uniref:Polyisoprenoid-binding protein YceI n=1 Tax=Epibacterium ulvae TaxID=1156985 RepID=A0A1G5QGP4_9RHOB|nr:YceI family protein [Epibacterium ulvae]SCZ61043.1 Polyisoprenoid-binding protein YceI [Epibacterium ulvae]
MARQRCAILNSLAAALILSFNAQHSIAGETYVTDQGHSEVRFSWDRGISVQTAEFTNFEGVLDFDAQNVENSSLEVVIDVSSLASGYAPLDKALLGESFFAGQQNPQIVFKSTDVKITGDSTANVTGDLTILGVTKPVTLQTQLMHRGPHPYAPYVDIYSGNWLAFEASTTIDHLAFNVGSYSAGPIAVTIVTEMKERN